MRVIAGSAKGRRLKSVRGARLRPTAERVREALFDILTSRFELRGAVVLDLFAGTGALGIEALSRGAARAVFVERGRAALNVLRANVELCGFARRAQIWTLPVRRAVREMSERGDRFDGVLLDPPYGRGLLGATLELIACSDVLHPGGWAVGEGHAEERVAGEYGALRLTRTRRYGKTCLVLYEAVFSDKRSTDG